MSLQIALDGRDPQEVRMTRSGGTATLWIDGVSFAAAIARSGGGAAALTVDGRTEQVWVVTERDRVHVHAFGRAWVLEVTDPVERSLRAKQGSDAATAPMPGVLVSLSVQPGDDVVAGQQLAVIESMKMHSEITAWRDGRVARVMVAIGDSFGQGAPLVALEPLDGDDPGGDDPDDDPEGGPA